jgi:hypothetical protein
MTCKWYHCYIPSHRFGTYKYLLWTLMFILCHKDIYSAEQFNIQFKCIWKKMSLKSFLHNFSLSNLSHIYFSKSRVIITIHPINTYFEISSFVFSVIAKYHSFLSGKILITLCCNKYKYPVYFMYFLKYVKVC